MRSAALALDHLVLATPDLAETTRWLARETGVVATPGGRHVGLGTRNELCALSPTSYLEIIGPDEAGSRTGPLPYGLDGMTEPHLVGWAIAVRDIDAAVGSARASGYDPGDAIDMHRDRPDGVRLSWRLTLGGTTTMPFLIDWLNSPHPAQSAADGLTLGELRAKDPDPADLARRLDALGVEMGIERGEASLVVALHGPLGTIEFG